MAELLTTWIPTLLLLALLAGAAWGAIGVSAASPGWGSIRGFLGLFGLGGLVGAWVPRRGLELLLDALGFAGAELGELPGAYRPGADLLASGFGQAVQLALLGIALQVSLWPNRAALRVAVALGLGSVFWTTLLAAGARGVEAVPPSHTLQLALGASAAALLLGSLTGVERKLAAWWFATMAMTLALWAGQSLPSAARPGAGLALLFAADRLLWSLAVGEGQGVERLYPLWRAAYEVHRQCRGARRLRELWRRIGWRERVFRALGNWLISALTLGAVAALAVLPLAVALAPARVGPLLLGLAGGAGLAVGTIGLAWAAVGVHAAHHPQWAFLAGLEERAPLDAEVWRRRLTPYLCVSLLGVACWLAAAA